MAEPSHPPEPTAGIGHARWVPVSHWLVALSFFALVFSGYVILKCHPRLYWGEACNDLMPALLELPIGEEPDPTSWKANVQFGEGKDAPVSQSRLHTIYNENSWGRSLHFLAAWFLVLPGLFYLLSGIFGGHFRRHFLPRLAEIAPRNVWREIADHLRLRVPPATGGPQYGLLQKVAYCTVVFVVFPLIVLTGLAMSPAVTQGYPFLGDLMGFQSARTIHFFSTVALVLFLLIHLVMVVRSGFKRQMRSMTIGRSQ